MTTLTTVGYGDTDPVTQDGRLGAMILMLLGIGLFSAITATITSYFISQERHRSSRDPRTQESRHFGRSRRATTVSVLAV